MKKIKPEPRPIPPMTFIEDEEKMPWWFWTVISVSLLVFALVVRWFIWNL